MSSDTGMENASVVDSSVTEWKHDVENLEDQESPSYKGGDDTCPSGAEEHVHNCDQAENSIASKRKKLYGTRYFIIKSLNHQNIELSIKKGIWATQVMNEPILEEAFHNSSKVILIFSVNMSGFFQGYAQMLSSVGWRRDNVWTQGSGGKNPWGRSFRVKWLRLYDLPFQKTLHLKNPWNDYKPVKISRDCQELPQDIGEALCSLLDGKDDTNANLESHMKSMSKPIAEGINDHITMLLDLPKEHGSRLIKSVVMIYALAAIQVRGPNTRTSDSIANQEGNFLLTLVFRYGVFVHVFWQAVNEIMLFEPPPERVLNMSCCTPTVSFD
ncbi:uncharacterized protein LOC127813884 isoform X2 [Diospyros lotus]|uniref:uncharacterized protein LOC127813884 isoform X2 n=1 Tax=Diospyros lotus TaxID=55363 RepID=UPI0022538F37|nr:uncharacterized protein LOC127813884 isoform X2 [Diospyros lotus]